MNRTLLTVLLCSVYLSVVVFCDEESIWSDQHHYSEEDVDDEGLYDENDIHDEDNNVKPLSESASGEFRELDPEEQKLRVNHLLDLMDTNDNGKIEKEEIANWTYESLKNLDQEQIHNDFINNDKDKDEHVTFVEFLDTNYGYSEEDVIAAKNGRVLDSDPENMDDVVAGIEDERWKFQMADADKDGYLDEEEFAAFTQPWNHEYMYGYESSRTIADNDKNNDGMVDFYEFVGLTEDNPDRILEEEEEISERENFKKFDKNKNGFLDNEEVIPWVVPDNKGTAMNEADHMMERTDENKDGVLSREEIMAQKNFWASSAVTNYGDDLISMSHDEL